MKWKIRNRKWRWGFLLCACLLFAFCPQKAAAEETSAGEVAINETNIPDATFRSYVSSNFDEDSDGSNNGGTGDSSGNGDSGDLNNGGTGDSSGNDNVMLIKCRSKAYFSKLLRIRR